ncbi:hypothetical protein TCAP_02083 [Tolypocladium capitatum]|uniref:Uncharacterized protein n=1 Tax=Tolypocladium capitatum TaxID=45235 RepID=A0A2K3QKC3_9HYPO|nr:hypothetical protein TCAP_02083 [Tolypocladium capitatum]
MCSREAQEVGDRGQMQLRRASRWKVRLWLAWVAATACSVTGRTCVGRRNSAGVVNEGRGQMSGAIAASSSLVGGVVGRRRRWSASLVGVASGRHSPVRGGGRDVTMQAQPQAYPRKRAWLTEAPAMGLKRSAGEGVDEVSLACGADEFLTLGGVALPGYRRPVQ